jgi:hypothetical protein
VPHTVKATAELVHQCGGQFVFPVKENRQALFDALNTLPWNHIPVADSSMDKGHTPITHRTIQVAPRPICRSPMSSLKEWGRSSPRIWLVLQSLLAGFWARLGTRH